MASKDPSGGTGFAGKLQELLDEREMTGSDLARRIWGEAPPDSRGYTKARGRDRISNYLSGKIVPTRKTLQEIADALKIEIEELEEALPEGSRSGPGASKPVDVETARYKGRMRVTVLPEDPDTWRFEVSVVLPSDIARQAIDLLKPYAIPE